MNNYDTFDIVWHTCTCIS